MRLAAFAVLAVFAWTASAHASDGEVLVYAEGDPTLDAELASDLPAGTTRQGGDKVSAALRTKKLRGNLRKALADKRRSQVLSTLTDVLKETGASAVVVGAGGGKTGAVILVVAKDGGPDERTTSDRAERSAFLKEELGRYAPKPPPAPAPPAPVAETPALAPASQDRPAAVSPVDAHDIGHALFVVGAGIETGSRSFGYHEPVSTNLRDYATGSVSPFVSGEVYPLARSGIAFAKDLAVTGRWARSVGLDSQTSDGKKADTTWDRFRVGLRGRVRLGEGPSPLLLGVEAIYGRSVFAIADSAAPAAEVPSARYSQLLVSADIRARLARFVAIEGGARGGKVLVDAPIDTRFAAASAGEVDVFAGLVIPIVPLVEVAASVEYDRIFIAMNAKATDTYVAGGALDQNVFARAEARVHW